MLSKKIAQVPAAPVELAGAKDVKVRVLFGPKDQAPTFALRQFELEGGGCTPYHEHPFEHEVVVMEGALAVVTKEGQTPITVGDVVMVSPGEKHQFKNTSADQPAKMLCIVPVEYQK